MPELIGEPSRVTAAGEPPKLIDEYVGRVNSAESRISIAHMRSPSGWAEPGQRPEFDEFTVVLRGALLVEFDGGQLTVQAGQAVHAAPASGCATERVQSRRGRGLGRARAGRARGGAGGTR